MTLDQNLFHELRVIEKETFWRAVEARDAGFNGVFVYGVRSTGIYCKPSCPARRRARLRHEPRGVGHAMPPRSSLRRSAGRLSLGDRA